MSERPLKSIAREVELYRSVLGEGGAEPGDPERDQLVATLRHYQTLFNRAPVGHLVLDPDGVVLEANEAAVELAGGARLLGRPLASQLATGADDLRLRHHLFDAFASQRRQRCELQLRTAAGETAPVRLESMADAYQRMCLTAMVEIEPVPREVSSILVVEDERLVRIVLRHYLQRAGYEVIEAHDLEDALGIGRRVDLLITDVVLPTITGPQLAAHLCLANPELRVLYMSAHPKELLVATRRLQPDFELLQKPFSEAALLAAIQKV